MTVEKTIPFKKAILEKLNPADGEWRYAKGIEYLCIRVFENNKTYYASWSTPVIGEDGRLRYIGKKKKNIIVSMIWKWTPNNSRAGKLKRFLNP